MSDMTMSDVFEDVFKKRFTIWTMGASCNARSDFDTADDALAAKERLISQGFEVGDEVWFGCKLNKGFEGCLMVMVREGGFDE